MDGQETELLIPECENCHYWHGRIVDDMTECHRHAPVLVDDERVAIWPRTARDDFCGDHVRHEDE